MAEKNPFARFLSHFPAGKVLFREGDAGEDMYIIQSGRVAIKKRTGANKDVTLAVLEKARAFQDPKTLQGDKMIADLLFNSQRYRESAEILRAVVAASPAVVVALAAEAVILAMVTR